MAMYNANMPHVVSGLPDKPDNNDGCGVGRRSRENMEQCSECLSAARRRVSQWWAAPVPTTTDEPRDAPSGEIQTFKDARTILFNFANK
jgi:hypothetical protein